MDTGCKCCFRRSKTRNVLDSAVDIPDVSNGRDFPIKVVYRT